MNKSVHVRRLKKLTDQDADSLLLPSCCFQFFQMMKQVLQAFADDNFNSKHYPLLHGTSSADVKPFAMMVKRKRNIFKRPFTKSEFIIIAGLENYVKEDKKEEFLECVKAKKQTQDDLEITEYDEEEEPPKR